MTNVDRLECEVLKKIYRRPDNMVPSACILNYCWWDDSMYDFRWGWCVGHGLRFLFGESRLCWRRLSQGWVSEYDRYVIQLFPHNKMSQILPNHSNSYGTKALLLPRLSCAKIVNIPMILGYHDNIHSFSPTFSRNKWRFWVWCKHLSRNGSIWSIWIKVESSKQVGRYVKGMG